MKKRLLSLCLMLALALAMTTTAFAEGTGTNVIDTGGNGSSSITVSEVVEGQTYAVYKLFDLTYSEANNNKVAYTYTDQSAEETPDAFLGALKDATNSPFQLAQIGSTDVYKVEAREDTTAQDITDFMKKLLSDNPSALTSVAESTAGASDTAIQFTGLAPGYYYITSTLGSLAILDSTTPSVEVKEKNGVPNNEKKVLEGADYGTTSDASIGDTVYFQSTIVTQKAGENYVYHDQMSDGLTFDANSVQIYIKDNDGSYYLVDGAYVQLSGETENGVGDKFSLVQPINYDVESENCNDGCTFEIQFKPDYTADLELGSELVITYSATLNEKAAVTTGTAGTGTGDGATANTNQSYLTYGEDNRTEPSYTYTYTWELDVFKYYNDDNNNEMPLAGADFVLYREMTEKVNGEDTTVKYYAVVGDLNTLTGWTKNSTSDRAEDKDDSKYASTFTSTGAADSKIAIRGLDAGTYYLEETKAPDGYNKLTSAIQVTITSSEKSTGRSITLTVGQGGTVDSNVVKVENKAGSELPGTGGTGTTILYVVGTVLVIGAGVLLVVKRRMNSEK